MKLCCWQNYTSTLCTETPTYITKKKLFFFLNENNWLSARISFQKFLQTTKRPLRFLTHLLKVEFSHSLNDPTPRPPPQPFPLWLKNFYTLWVLSSSSSPAISTICHTSWFRFQHKRHGSIYNRVMHKFFRFFQQQYLCLKT